MQLKWLEDFVALAETRSFSRAAELRHVTHPAFGRRIKQLENWAGAALIDRTGYPAKLTAEGEVFLEHARDAVRVLRDGRESVAQHGNAPATRLRIATGSTLGSTQYPKWLAAMHAAVGPFEATVSTGSIHDALERLAEGQCEFAITYSHPALMISADVAHVDACEVGREELVPVCTFGADYALPGTRKVPLPLLMLSPALAMAHVIRARLQTAPLIHAKTLQTVDSAATLHALVRAGLGVAWLPASLVAVDLHARVLKQLPDVIAIHLGVRLYRPRAFASPAAALAEKVWTASAQRA